MAATNREVWELAPGELIDSKYTIVDQLGRGNYSMVYLARSTATARHNTSSLVVLKVPKPAPTSPLGVGDFEEKLARNEIALLRREQQGPSFDSTDEARARLLLPDGAFEYSSLERPILLFTELCGPSVHEFARSCDNGRMSWAMARRTISDTLKAVQFLHEHSIGHGDLHTRNLLLVPSRSLSTWSEVTMQTFLKARKPIVDQDPRLLVATDIRGMTAFFEQASIRFEGSIKLADFGSGFEVDDGGRGYSPVGVRGDVKSPERMELRDWGLQADIWCLGCTLLEILTGRLFFEMSAPLKKKWSNELGLEMIRNTLGPDDNGDDAARSALKGFLSSDHERSDVTSHEIETVEEMAARSIRWRPEVRSGVADMRRIWEGERLPGSTRLSLVSH